MDYDGSPSPKRGQAKQDKPEGDAWADREWRPCGLCMPTVDDLVKEDVLDVLKLALRPRQPPEKPGLSNTLKAARDALAEDPYNLLLINELGRLYAQEARWDKCANVLLRGWKRASEIKDDKIRFCFLMKLCEVSVRLSQFRQAHAVLQDIEEPTEGFERKAYLVMCVQVYANCGDVQRALKSFQRAIEGETFSRAVRIFALTLFDLQKAGAFQSAKSALEKMSPGYHDRSTLQMLETFAERQEQKANQWDPTKLLIITGVAVVFMIIVYLLWLLEQWSLNRIKK